MTNDKRKKAIRLALTSGKPILLYDFDDREAETDLIYYGPKTTPQSIKELRIKAGAPISVYIDFETGEKLGITTFPSFIRSIKSSNSNILQKLIKSDSNIEARFSLTFDYRKNKTGCSHFETSRTVKKLSALIAKKNYNTFPRTSSITF